MNDNFTPSDSDLVFRRKERWVLLAVTVFEAIFFTAILLFVIPNHKPQEQLIVASAMGVSVLLLALITVGMWIYEIRVTPYELVIKSLTGVKVIPFSMIAGLERVKVQGKTPETFMLKVRTSDDRKLTLPDVRQGLYDLHTELGARCKALARMEEKILEP
jgi:hypothetical protein